MTAGEIRELRDITLHNIGSLSECKWLAAGDALDKIRDAVEGAIRFHKFNREENKRKLP